MAGAGTTAGAGTMDLITETGSLIQTVEGDIITEIHYLIAVLLLPLEDGLT